MDGWHFIRKLVILLVRSTKRNQKDSSCFPRLAGWTSHSQVHTAKLLPNIRMVRWRPRFSRRKKELPSTHSRINMEVLCKARVANNRRLAKNMTCLSKELAEGNSHWKLLKAGINNLLIPQLRIDKHDIISTAST